MSIELVCKPTTSGLGEQHGKKGWLSITITLIEHYPVLKASGQFLMHHVSSIVEISSVPETAPLPLSHTLCDFLHSETEQVVADHSSSRATRARAKEGKITVFDSDERLMENCDYILSICPPNDAYSTARRIALALQRNPHVRSTPLYFLELNAISPRTVRTIADMFRGLPAVFIDGGIIGGPPKPKVSLGNGDAESEWMKPNIPLSGPKKLIYAPTSGPHLASVLNTRHISDRIGQASGLKMCFACTTKGLHAILIQSFTTAAQLGILEDLKKEMRDMNPQMLASAERNLPTIPPKAHRWVREMEEIASTFSEEGGFGEELFLGVASVFKTMVEDTVLGDERPHDRDRGQTLDDVAQAMKEGMYLGQKDGPDDNDGPAKNHIGG